MKKTFLILSLLSAVGLVFAQFSISAGSTNYTQDFNTLTSGTWQNGVTLTGWYARTSATESITSYGANTGTTTTAGLYAYGVDETNPLTDRALGYAPSNTYTGASGSGLGLMGWRLKNNTGSTVSSITVTWTGEQWRVNGNTATHYLNLSYQIGSTVTDLIAGTWTSASSQFASPITTGTMALDGNATANRIPNISVTISGLNLTNGQEIMLRWDDLNDSGNDHFLAIDDVTVNATISSAPPQVATPEFDPGSGTSYAALNVTISCATTGATIYYTTDESDPSDSSTEYTDPISITQTTTLKAIAYADGYDPSNVATATYTLPITVNNIAELRAGAVGSTLYYLSNEVILTYQMSAYPWGKYIQDATGAIYIYDTAHVITTAYNQYDGITGIYGTLILYNGLLEFIPTQNTMAASSTGNTVTPEVKTLSSVTSADQSKLIRLNGVTFSSTGSFVLDTSYPITDASKGSGNVRTTLPGVDYLGTPVPSDEGDLICLVGWYNAVQYTPRALSDFIDFGATPYVEVDPATLSGFTYEYLLGPSAEQSFTVSGTNLTADINLTAPTNYEISTTTGANFGPSLTLTAAKLDVNTTTIYVRLKAGLAIGTYNDELITASSTGAIDQTVTCSGEVTSPPPPDEPVAGEGSGVSETGFTATWNAVSGATGYYLDVYTMEAGGNASDLFISEYVEGGGYNKAIEIYNGTGTPVNLASYSVKRQTNGAGDFGSDLSLTGTLATGDVYVIAYNANTPNLSEEPYVDLSTNSNALNFNGNDAVALFSGTTMVDVVGIVDQVSPNWGANVTLVRQADATAPSTNYIASEWDSYAQDTFSYLGYHTFSAGTVTYVTGYENLNVGNVTSYSVTGLEPGTTYYYVVRAYNDYGTSGNSEPIDVITDEEPLPVELASFTATISAQNYITLTWVTQTETGMQGYYIFRDSDSNLAGAQMVSPLIPSANSSQMQTYVFEDTEVYDTSTYYYWLQANDMDGTVGFHGPVSVFYNALGDNPTPEIPLVTELKSVYPNPFNPVVFIPFSLAKDSNVSFKIYNARGQIVKHFELGSKAAGNYRITWDGTDYNGAALSNGVYQIVMTAGSQVYQTKTTLLK